MNHATTPVVNAAGHPVVVEESLDLPGAEDVDLDAEEALDAAVDVLSGLCILNNR